MADALRVWRHPRPEGAAGRCVGARTDLRVDRRRAKRLARRIQALARRERLPHEVWTSPLARAADVGRWLRRWGWRHHVAPTLRELDFGAWDGRLWTHIGQARVDGWVAGFARHAPGGGESVATLVRRVAACRLPPGALVVGHGGWMVARRWLATHAPDEVDAIAAADWPAAPRYGTCWKLHSDLGG